MKANHEGPRLKTKKTFPLLKNTALMATRNPARKPVDMENLPLFTVLFLYVRWCRISSIYGISQYGESSSNGVNSILQSCIENHRESQLFVMNVVGLRESYIFWLQKPRLPPKKLRHKNLDKKTILDILGELIIIEPVSCCLFI